MRTISDHITDLVQNSVRALAKLIEIIVREENNCNLYVLLIRDNGAGMDNESVKIATDPFYTTRKTRKTGLGLALARQAAEQAGGYLRLCSEPGKGTQVEVAFGLNHIDRPPMGDIAGTMLLLAIGNENIIFRYTHSTEHGTYCFDTAELYDLLEGIPLSNHEIMASVRSLFLNNLNEIYASK